MDGNVDVVFHLASPASPPDYLRHPIDTLKVGALGTLNAFDLAADKGAVFVLASTSEVYGDPEVHPQPETYWGNVNPVGPRSVYDEAKRYAEALAMAYHRDRGVGREDREDLQYVRSGDAPRRRPCRASLCRSGAARRSDSPCMATGRRRARSASWTISSKGSGCSQRLNTSDR